MKEEILENLELWNDDNGNPVSASDLFEIAGVVVDTIDGMQIISEAIELDINKGLGKK